MTGHLRLRAPAALNMLRGPDYCSPELRATLAYRRATFRKVSRRPPR